MIVVETWLVVESLSDIEGLSAAEDVLVIAGIEGVWVDEEVSVTEGVSAPPVI